MGEAVLQVCGKRSHANTAERAGTESSNLLQPVCRLRIRRISELYFVHMIRIVVCRRLSAAWNSRGHVCGRRTCVPDSRSDSGSNVCVGYHRWSTNKLIEGCVQEHIDWKEVVVYAAYGPLLSNFGHTWYRHLHVFTNRTLRMSTWQMISTKLAADALVFGPMHVTALLTWTHFLNARPAQVRFTDSVFTILTI